MIAMVVDIFMDTKLSVIDHVVQQLFKMCKRVQDVSNRGFINQPQCPWLAPQSNFEKNWAEQYSILSLNLMIVWKFHLCLATSTIIGILSSKIICHLWRHSLHNCDKIATSYFMKQNFLFSNKCIASTLSFYMK